ncbi:hypothetical protein SteCoe_14180 [Stentor coeruleus]|uniref:Uncharacterized protein n=1 Tax=Stentor coeruleus TaxID=5963 RepID=A0A1R2C6Q7_9CILI|nr:hypothetical protein SteCoe_14180 [Stentor coeruleus]
MFAAIAFFGIITMVSSQLTVVVASQPATTNDYFTVVVTGTTASDVVSITSNGELENSPSGTATGTSITFSSLRFLSGGDDLSISASSSAYPTDLPVSSASFKVDKALLIIILDYGNVDIYVNKNFTITFLLVDQNNKPWIDPENLKLEYTGITENYSLDGIVTKSIKLLKSGNQSIVATIENKNSTTIQVDVLKLNIDILPGRLLSYESDILQKLEFNVKNGINPDTDNIYDMTITLVCNNICSGTYFLSLDEQITDKKTSIIKQTNFGEVKFEDFFVISSGTFNFEIKCNLCETAYSAQFIVTNKLISINMTSSVTEQAAFFYLSIEVNLIGEDENKFIQTVELEMEDNPSVKGIDNLQIDEGQRTYDQVYFIDIGDKELILKNKDGSIKGSISIKITPDYLKITNMIEILPANTNHYLEFQVEIYDKEDGKLETNHNHNVVAELDPVGKIEGEFNKTTNNGTVYFYNLQIKTAGTFSLKAISDNISEIVYDKQLKISLTDCNVGSGPVASMSILVFLGIFITFIFFRVDKEKKSFGWNGFIMLLIHPFSALFISSPPKRRALLCLQLCVSELLMLTLIGAVYAYFDTPLEHYEKDFTDYYGRQLYKGAFGWALAQVGIIPMFFLNFYTLGAKKLTIYVIMIYIILTVLCFGAIVGMTCEYCIGYSIYWTVNFLIFLLFDLFFMQVIYTVIAYFLKTQKIKRVLNNEAKKSRTKTGMIDNNLKENHENEAENNQA